MNKVYECSGCGWTGTKAEHKAMMERPGVIACCPDMKLVEMSNPDLLPCPFCGGTPEVALNADGDYEVYCNTEWCLSYTFIALPSRDEVVAVWNDRYHIPPPIRTAPGCAGPMVGIEVALGESATVEGNP